MALHEIRLVLDALCVFSILLAQPILLPHPVFFFLLFGVIRQSLLGRLDIKRLLLQLLHNDFVVVLLISLYSLQLLGLHTFSFVGLLATLGDGVKSLLFSFLPLFLD